MVSKAGLKYLLEERVNSQNNGLRTHFIHYEDVFRWIVNVLPSVFVLHLRKKKTDREEEQTLVVLAL